MSQIDDAVAPRRQPGSLAVLGESGQGRCDGWASGDPRHRADSGLDGECMMPPQARVIGSPLAGGRGAVVAWAAPPPRNISLGVDSELGNWYDTHMEKIHTNTKTHSSRSGAITDCGRSIASTAAAVTFTANPVPASDVVPAGKATCGNCRRTHRSRVEAWEA